MAPAQDMRRGHESFPEARRSGALSSAKMEAGKKWQRLPDSEHSMEDCLSVARQRHPAGLQLSSTINQA